MDSVSYTLIQEVLSAMNNKHTVGGIFCDLSKAFDCEPQNPTVEIRALWNKRNIWSLN